MASFSEHKRTQLIRKFNCYCHIIEYDLSLRLLPSYHFSFFSNVFTCIGKVVKMKIHQVRKLLGISTDKINNKSRHSSTRQTLF